ncbi:MAG: VID27 cytoplasmic protein-domain-containing protein [Monoraphidium minutum]|nr:MAG: VID27 cytoplasmic protein-domain-containing protein [Monoraphidium minutum]
MGNTTSTDVQEAVEEVEQQQAEEAQGPPGIKLFEFVRAASGAASWSQLSGHAAPRLYDANDGDGAGGSRARAEWMLEVDAGDIDARADEALQYVADRGARRVTFAAGGRLYALRFPDAGGFSDFLEELESKVFYNTYGFDDDEDGRSKVLGDFRDAWFKGGGDAPEPMEEEGEAGDDGPDPSEMRERAGADKQGTPINAMIIGANENTFLQRGSQFDVMRNVEGGIEDAGARGGGGLGAVGCVLGGGSAPPGTPSFLTPGKVILAQGETRMNMISPEIRDRLFHADIEYQKVVSEWTFNKDGVEIPQADIANDHKAAQLEDINTFLGLDSNSGDGFVVVGSKDGKLRLYNNKTLTQAKTQIPGLGKAITAVDVTYDGAYVLATTDDYIMVVKTTVADPVSGKELNGFQDRIGAKLSMPRLLRLKPEDVMVTGGKPLRGAKFTWVRAAFYNGTHCEGGQG